LKQSQAQAVVPILCVTRDEQGAVASTVATIYQALQGLGRRGHYLQNGGFGYAQARTNLFRAAQQVYKTDKVRGFLLDDDICFVEQPSLEAAIRKADQNGWNLVGAYRTKTGRFSLIKIVPPKPSGTTTEMMLEADLAEIKPYQEIPSGMAGLGFYYGDIPLDYEFREGNPYTGEDLNFFNDNKQLHPRLAPLFLEHLKQMRLPGARWS
jgi:hypothetical protein